MTSLLYLKHSFNLSDEEVAQRWSENVAPSHERMLSSAVAQAKV